MDFALRPPVSIKSTDRAQMALNLGTLIADGYIAVEAHDGQQVKNVGKDVLAIARNSAFPKVFWPAAPALPNSLKPMLGIN